MRHAIRKHAAPSGRAAVVIVTLGLAVSAALLVRVRDAAPRDRALARAAASAERVPMLSPGEVDDVADRREIVPSPGAGDSEYVALVKIPRRRTRMISARPVLHTDPTPRVPPPWTAAATDTCAQVPVAIAPRTVRARQGTAPADPLRAD